LGVSPKVEGSESTFGKLEVGAGRGEGEIREGAIVGSGGTGCNGNVVKDRKKQFEQFYV
jgi:hypothetical protein